MKIDKIQINGTIYDINGPATAQEYGLIKLGYTENNKNYPVLLSEGKAYVNVPWENTQYTLAGLMGSTAKGSVTQPIYWDGSSFVSTTCSLEANVPSNAVFTDTTYSNATTTSAGLMSASDKSRLDGLQNYTLQTATSSSLGGIKAEPHSTAVSLENISDTANRYYQIEVDSNGKAFVNVPWVASQGGGEPAAGFSSVSAGNTTISSSVQPDLYISSHGGTSVTVAQGISSLVDKSVVYIDVNAATNTQYGGMKIDTQSSLIDLTAKNYPVLLDNNGFAFVNVPVTDGSDGVGISDITITYAASSSGTNPPADNQGATVNWDSSIPAITPGEYLWTKIVITTTASSNNIFIAYSVARQGANGSGGGSSSPMAISSADSLVVNNTLQADPNILYRFTNPVSALTIQLQQPSSNSVAVEYLFRFKTASSGVNIAFTDHLDQTTDILYPFDYIINADTEYEISVLYDGSKYLVSECAYN